MKKASFREIFAKLSLTAWLAAGICCAGSALSGCAENASLPDGAPESVSGYADSEESAGEAPGPGGSSSENSGSEETEMKVEIGIGDKIFSATLADNETARAFMALLPATMTMNELNGNEKYKYLDVALPTDAYRPGRIEAGDLMLYGDSCLVLFYESFSTSYSYTRIGKIGNAAGLAEAAGDSAVSVSFVSADEKTAI